MSRELLNGGEGRAKGSTLVPNRIEADESDGVQVEPHRTAMDGAAESPQRASTFQSRQRRRSRCIARKEVVASLGALRDLQGFPGCSQHIGSHFREGPARINHVGLVTIPIKFPYFLGARPNVLFAFNGLASHGQIWMEA